MDRHTLFGYIGVAAIVLLILGLLGWFFFLRGQTGDITALDAARGFDIAVPSFTGSRSSTSENIASGGATELKLTASEGAQKPPRLWRVSLAPVAGMGFLATSSTLRYMERSSGHVYDVDPKTGAVVRRTNTTIPKVYEAHVLGSGSMILRTIDDVGDTLTLVGQFGTTTDDGLLELETENLGTNIRAIASAGSTIVLVADVAQGAEVVRMQGTTVQKVLSLALKSLEPLALSDGRLFLAERPASALPSSAFEIVSGALTPFLRTIPGLAFLPRNSSTMYLYSSDDGRSVRLFLQPAAGAAVVEFPIATSAKKCVWTSSSATTTGAYCAVPQSPLPAGYTDLSARGALHSADAWYTLDTASGKAERFFTPETSVALDVESPMIDMSGEYLSFINARDKSLWVLRIND